MLRVIIRLNPVNMQIFQFNEIIEDLSEDASKEKVCTVVGQAIKNVDLANAVAELDDFDASIMEIASDMVLDIEKDMKKCISEYRNYIPNLPDFQQLSNHHTQHLINAIHSNRKSLIELESHYKQLNEYWPRYSSIMNRSDFMDGIIGFAAGFFGGELGIAGIGMWEGWRGKSDNEFVNVFASAVEQFSSSGTGFTQELESLVEPTIQQLTSDIREIYNIVFLAFESFVRDGWDVEPFYRIFRAIETPIDEDFIQLFEIILNNLREQGLSTSSEMNLKSFFGL